MILAAAIKYRIEKTGKEVILCGARHENIFKQIEDLGFKPRDGYKEIEQGFIDHHNNFLTRKEAYRHAKMCGQLCDKIIYDRERVESYPLISGFMVGGRYYGYKDV